LTSLVAVTIPIFKEVPDSREQEALRQCLDVLHKYPVIFFAPQSLKANFYTGLTGGRNQSTIERFEDKYFTGPETYNKLLLNKKFYKRFKHFKYILIYQLDAYVFKDELQHWCKIGYDYIGAPWFNDFHAANSGSQFFGVGNGGFSLRNVNSHLKVLSSFSYIKSYSEIKWEFLSGPKTYKNLLRLLRNLTITNNTFNRFNDYDRNEDFFWGVIVKKKFKWFNVPGMVTAAKFSFEVNAAKLFDLIGQDLPFGCHALLKYDPDFFNRLKNISNNKSGHTL